MRLRDKIRLALFANRLLDALPNIEVMKEKLASRKLWAAVAGAMLTTFGQQLGLSPEILNNIVTIIVAYIAGQGIVDAAKGFRG